MEPVNSASPTMSVRTISLNEIAVSEKETHIVIYNGQPNESSELKKQLDTLSAELDKLSKRVLHLELGIETKPYFSTDISPEPEGLKVNRRSDVSDIKTVFLNIPAAPEPEPEVEEEALELEEFEYKGVTYYRDSENKVYQQDDDGDLDDTPIGVWSPEKEKVLKYKV